MIEYPLNVTIDTNIFVANKFDFGDDSTMSLLVKNVQNGKIKLVLSNIVIKEVEKHICQRVHSICGKAKELRKVYGKIFPEQYFDDFGMGMYMKKPDKGEIEKNVKEKFSKFLEDCKVERLDASEIDIEKILEDYFAIRPPFEESEKKRKEFPDAFIAQEIGNRFDKETVAIISQDKGFREACAGIKNHLFFTSLSDLFDTLNKNDKEYYANALELIKDCAASILQTIEEMIDDSCIEVRGLSIDRYGVVEGYDYDETYLKCCRLSNLKIHTIDDIGSDTITASLWIHGYMEVDCYFKDFDNASWDSEDKEYIFVETKNFLEKHDVRFACRIELDRETKEIRVLPFRVVLGGGSRKSRTEIYGE